MSDNKLTDSEMMAKFRNIVVMNEANRWVDKAVSPVIQTATKAVNKWKNPSTAGQAEKSIGSGVSSRAERAAQDAADAAKVKPRQDQRAKEVGDDVIASRQNQKQLPPPGATPGGATSGATSGGATSANQLPATRGNTTPDNVQQGRGMRDIGGGPSGNNSPTGGAGIQSRVPTKVSNTTKLATGAATAAAVTGGAALIGQDDSNKKQPQSSAQSKPTAGKPAAPASKPGVKQKPKTGSKPAGKAGSKLTPQEEMEMNVLSVDIEKYLQQHPEDQAAKAALQKYKSVYK